MKIKMLWLLAGTFCFLSCGLNQTESLTRQRLFNLSYGILSNKLNFFMDQYHSFDQNIDICENNGFIYISDGRAGKVMKMNSYGDLINLYYNPEKTTPPQYMLQEEDLEVASSQSAMEWPFMSPDKIAVTSEGNILVSDLIPQNRYLSDPDRNIILNRLVYVFNNNSYLFTLGQEGLGGTPFPFIEDIKITTQDEIVVICRSETTYLVYWFNKEGKLLFPVEITRDSLPPREEEGAYLSIQNVFPDAESSVLYTQVNYFKEVTSEDGVMNLGIAFLESTLIPLNLETGIYEKAISIPKNIIKTEETGLFEYSESEYPYEFLGIAENNRFYFTSYAAKDQKKLLVINSEGKVLHQNNILFEESSIYYSVVDLNNKGLLSALLCGIDSAETVWWRSDLLKGSSLEYE